MNFIKPLTSLLLVLSSTFVYSQNGEYMNNWYFGEYAAINFDNGTPSSMSNSAMDSFEGCASISDNSGNLLFYTNGGGLGSTSLSGGVWNQNHELMPNGNLDSLIGCNSSSQSSLIIKKTSDEYYLFTTGCSEVEKSLNYSIIDMNLDGGLGDLSVKGISLIGSQDTIISETVGGTKHSNGMDYWVVTHGVTNNTFYVFNVTPNGISGPTSYTVGNISFGTGELKFDMSGSRLAYSYEVYDFDNSTGVISNPVPLDIQGFNKAFSPSGRFIYVNSMSGMSLGLYQYDLLAADVLASRVQITTGSSPTGGLQLGPDSKIYVCWGGSSLDVVNDPDNAGLACNFVANQVLLSGSGANLPNFVLSHTAIIGVEELSGSNSEKALIQITDLMGRTCKFSPNAPLLYYYSDGSIERVLKVD